MTPHKGIGYVCCVQVKKGRQIKRYLSTRTHTSGIRCTFFPFTLLPFNPFTLLPTYPFTPLRCTSAPSVLVTTPRRRVLAPACRVLSPDPWRTIWVIILQCPFLPLHLTQREGPSKKGMWCLFRLPYSMATSRVRFQYNVPNGAMVLSKT